MKRMRIRDLNAAGLFALALALLLSCSEERGLQPVPEKHRLYAAVYPEPPEWDGYILGIDCETDSIVDSLSLPSWTQSWRDIFPLPDRSLLIVPDHGVHMVYDVRANSYIASLAYELRSVAAVPEYGRIIGGMGNGGLAYEDTNYTIRGEYVHGIGNCKRIGQTSHVIGLDPNSSRFFIYDVVSGAAVDSFLIFSEAEGNQLHFSNFDISPDGTRLYGFSGSGALVSGYDIPQRRALFLYQLIGGMSGNGSCFVSPDGEEIWVTWGWNPFGIPWPQSVHILDALTGQLLDTLDISAGALGLSGRVAGDQIRFVPNTSKTYISCQWSPTLIVADRETHTIVKLLLRGRPAKIALGPSP